MQQAIVEKATLAWSPLQSGRSYVERRLFEVGPICVAHRAYRAAYKSDVTVPPGSVLLGIPGSRGAEIRWNGLCVASGDLISAQGYVAVYALGAARFFTVMLDLIELRRRYPAASELFECFEQSSGHPTLWRGTDVRRLRAYLGELLRRARFPDRSPLSAERHLFPLVAAAIGAKSEAVKPSHSQSRRIKAVLDCQMYMLARRGESVTLLELSAISGLRPRSLINAFQAVTSLSPMAFLRALRLARVREALSDGSAFHARVIDVATDWGFWHMGHFTAAYRAMFGETPSETLRRGASLNEGVLG